MIDVDYIKSEKLFNREWGKYQEFLKDRGRKVPQNPSPGWLQGVAAHFNLCTALMHKLNGQYRICGRPIKDYPSNDPYFCTRHDEVIRKNKTHKAT